MRTNDPVYIKRHKIVKNIILGVIYALGLSGFICQIIGSDCYIDKEERFAHKEEWENNTQCSRILYASIIQILIARVAVLVIDIYAFVMIMIVCSQNKQKIRKTICAQIVFLTFFII